MESCSGDNKAPCSEPMRFRCPGTNRGQYKYYRTGQRKMTIKYPLLNTADPISPLTLFPSILPENMAREIGLAPQLRSDCKHERSRSKRSMMASSSARCLLLGLIVVVGLDGVNSFLSRARFLLPVAGIPATSMHCSTHSPLVQMVDPRVCCILG
eukprot:1609527-Rhodomonas_salina.1